MADQAPPALQSSRDTHPPLPVKRLAGEKKETDDRYVVVTETVKKLENAGYSPTHDDVMCIFSNQTAFQRSCLTAEEIQEAIDCHKVFSALLILSPKNSAKYFTQPQPITLGEKRKRKGEEEEGEEDDDDEEEEKEEDEEEEGTKPTTSKAKKKDKAKKEEAERSRQARDTANERDEDKCVWQWTPNHHQSHSFPFAATKTDKAVKITERCFIVVKWRFGEEVYDVWHPCASRRGGFEGSFNLTGLGVQLHEWLDMGFLAFQYVSHGPRPCGTRWFVQIMLYWLPFCRPKAKPETPAIIDNSEDDTVRLLIGQLEDAYKQGFQPRRPASGTGIMKAFFQDRREIESGSTVKIDHKTLDDCEKYKQLIEFHWFGMTTLTYRGVTKGFVERRPRGRPKGSGKQKAVLASGPPAIPPSNPAVSAGDTRAVSLQVPPSQRIPLRGPRNVSAQVPTAGPSQPARRGGAARGGAARGGAARGGAARGGAARGGAARGGSGNTGQ